MVQAMPNGKSQSTEKFIELFDRYALPATLGLVAYLVFESPYPAAAVAAGALTQARAAADPPLFRVRIGPIGGVDDYDALVTKLEALGIADPYLVSL